MFLATLFLIIFFASCLLYAQKISKHGLMNCYLFLFFVLFLVIGLRGEGVDHDYLNYIDALRENTGSIGEPTFLLLSYVMQTLQIPNCFLFLFYSFCGIGLKFLAICRYSSWPSASLLIYFSNFLLLHDMNQIRAGVSSGIFLCALPYLAQNKKKQYLILSLLAVLFHFSSIVFFVLMKFKNTPIPHGARFYWGIFPFFCLMLHMFDLGYLLQYIPFDFIRLKLEMYVTLQQEGAEGFAEVNLFNPYFLFKYIIYAIFLYRFDFYSEKSQYFPILLKVYGFSLTSFYLFSIITPIAGYRISELLGIVEILLFPLLFLIVKYDFVKKNALVAYLALLLLVNIFYKTMIYI